MTVKQVSDILEELAPLAYAEDFDNVGLLVGQPSMKVSGVLVTLDTLEHVVDEAIEKKCNLIVSFHPIIFKGLKKLNGSNYVERVVIKAIQHNIAIYSMHTALDNAILGVNDKICNMLNLQHKQILIPQKGTIKKLTTYVPIQQANSLKEALFAAGAGQIGNYSNCSFSVEGTGTYTPGEKSNPTIGEIGLPHSEAEVQLHITFEKAKERTIINTLLAEHPYEEVAYEVYTLENANQNIGIGMVGELAEPIDEKAFLDLLKTTFKTPCIRHSSLLNKPIKKVAVLGGSGAFAIGAAKGSGADIYVSADFKYHDFYQAEKKIILADIGHFETEQFTKNLLVDYLTKKMPNFAVSLSESITNPIKYY